MRYNRKACLRALQIASGDATCLPFGLVFSGRNVDGVRFNGVRQCYSTHYWKLFKARTITKDDAMSVRFVATGAPDSCYSSACSLLPGLKPRSLKKHELRKQARDLRRMKQYG